MAIAGKMRLCGDVAVCLCVCHVDLLIYCAKMTESIIMQPSLDCGPAIVVSRTKYEPDSSRGSLSLRMSNGRGVVRCWKYDQYSVRSCPLVNDCMSENRVNN